MKNGGKRGGFGYVGRIKNSGTQVVQAPIQTTVSKNCLLYTSGYLPIFFAWFEMEEYRRTPPPGFERTPEEQELAETFHLDDEQLAWRRWCIAANCGGDLDLFHQEYPSTPDEAFISTGRCVFDKAEIVLRREQVRELPWERGEFRARKDAAGKIVGWDWVRDPRGAVRILKKPENGVPYVIGGDTAGTGSDWFVGQVLDNRTGEIGRAHV